MAVLIDTDVAIHLRDGEPSVRLHLDTLTGPPRISAITRVELENGVYRHPSEVAVRRLRLDFILTRLTIIDFDEAAATVYGTIVRAVGVSRPDTIDRMIAATAILHGLTLVTMNGRDFRNLPGLTLDIWPSPTRPA